MKKRINNKNLFLILIPLVLIVVLASVFSVKIFKDKIKQKRIDEYLNQNVETYGELNVISDAVVIDGKKNTVAGIKEAIRLGADVITLDLCFDSKDIPYICDDYDKISDDGIKLEEIFTLLRDKKYSTIKLNLRLNQLGSLKNFNDLIKKYDMNGRVIISGLDKKRYNMLNCSETSAAVFFDCVPENNIKKATEQIFSLYDDYGISGVIISCNDITPELVEKLNQHGKTFIISDADDELSMYAAINSGANNIETSSPDKLIEIYKAWKDRTREKVEKSIINELKKGE